MTSKKRAPGAPKKKVGRPPSTKLTKKKAPKSTAPAAGHYHITIGSPNEPGPVRTFVREAKAREKMNAALDEWAPWCERYNTAGLKAIDEARDALGVAFTHDKRILDVCFDEHYNATIRFTMWTTEPKG